MSHQKGDKIKSLSVKACSSMIVADDQYFMPHCSRAFASLPRP